jgi:DNA-binding winged helix-turn-helix (wHTH) protein
MEKALPERLRFGSYEADLSARKLYQRGVEVHLPSKPFRLLEALLSRPGMMLSRAELAQALWPDTFVQFDQGLNAVVRKVRRVLNDRFESPLYLETVGKLGYRFIHPVEAAARGDTSRTNRPN